MIKKTFLFLAISAILATGQLLAQDDGLAIPSDESATAGQDRARFITEDYMIPSYNLYQQCWSYDHVRAKSLGFSFTAEQELKIILVDNNTPFTMPCKNYKVISEYGMRSGRMHTGIDLKQRLNDTIVSCFDGVVRMAKVYGDYGNIVVVRHYNGLETVYAHLNAITVKPDQIIKAGQCVGLAGRTGRASTEHLHFEVRFLFEHFNPAKMIDFTTGRLWSNVLSLGASDVDSTPATPEEKEVENTLNTTVNSFQSQQQEETPTVKTETVQKNEMETQEKTESKPSDAKVPTAQPQQDKQTVSPAPESAQAPSDKAVYYTIQRGDTLYGIAKKHGTTVQKICQLNNITEDTKIKADDKIRVK